MNGRRPPRKQRGTSQGGGEKATTDRLDPRQVFGHNTAGAELAVEATEVFGRAVAGLGLESIPVELSVYPLVDHDSDSSDD